MVFIMFTELCTYHNVILEHFQHPKKANIDPSLRLCELNL